MDVFNSHYIRHDEAGNIVKGFSDAFEAPLETDICITKTGGRQFELLGETNPCLQSPEGIYLYKYENGEAVKKTTDEIETEIAALPPVVLQPTLEERTAAVEGALISLLM